MIRAIDMAGQRAGKLLAIDFDASKHKWRCRCDCGKEAFVSGGNLRKLTTRSCGCLAAEVRAANKLKHGLSASPEYGVFMTMRAKCENPSNEKYADYGARGIKMNFASFEEFIEHVGRRPSKAHSIDRMNNDGHYEPGNVRWATLIEQRNNRRDSKLIAHDGITDSLTGWARRVGLSPSSLRSRVRKGWSIERVIKEPPDLKQQRNGLCQRKGGSSHPSTTGVHT